VGSLTAAAGLGVIDIQKLRRINIVASSGPICNSPSGPFAISNDREPTLRRAAYSIPHCRNEP
jgi:hypothetical protein